MEAHLQLIPRTRLEEYEPELLTYRRYLHAHPELSFQEFKTAEYIVEKMSQLEHAKIIRPIGTSVLVKFITGKPGPKIGLRADMDALAITEKRDDISFKSKNEGVMHACGHDGHTAILMAACCYFDEHFADLTGEVWAIFQHGEELYPGGAQQLVDTGLFNDLDFIYGQHLWASLPLGTIDIKEGFASAYDDRYTIHIQGKGGNASEPELTVDPVMIGAFIVSKLQAVMTRQKSPQDAGMISNTVFQAGNCDAVDMIPDHCLLAGTMRSTSDEMRAFFKNAIITMAEGTCAEFGATCEITFEEGYGMINNHPETTGFIREIANQMEETRVIKQKCMLSGEDFSAFSQIVPSTFVFIGATNPELGVDYPHHHPKFWIDERVLLYGLQLAVNAVLQYPRYFKNRINRD